MKLSTKFGWFSVLFGTAMCLNSSSFALDVTVNSEGGADVTTITEALDQIRANPDATMNTITITGGGPYEEPIVIDVPLTLVGADPVDRPIIVVMINNGGVEGRENDGIINSAAVDMVFENLIFIPSSFDWPTDDGFDLRPLSEEDDFDITLRNCLITTNDGNNAPITLTGETFEEDALFNGFSFQDDGFQVLSTFAGIPSGTVDVLIEDVVVTHIAFDAALDATGQDSFILGGENTTVTVRNTRVSYGDRWGMQLLSSVTVNIEGTEEEPVIIQGMGSAGLLCFGGTHNWDYLHLIENPLGARIDADFGVENNISNALIYGNTELGLGYFFNPDEGIERNYTITDSTFYNNLEHIAFRLSDDMSGVNLAISDTVVAGPEQDAFIVSALSEDPAVTQIFANVDISDTGISTFFGDRLETITETNVITDDPEFASTDPADPGFLVVTSPAYATAGSGGTPLGGYFPYGGDTNVTEWMMY